MLKFIPNTDYRYLWNVIGIAILILIIILIWNGKLTVARREADDAKKEAQEANSAKTKFLANMSHELRTPLNSILLLSKLLKENNDKNLNERQVKHINTINESGSELLLLIDEILDLSKIETEHIHLNEDKIELRGVHDYISNVFEPQANESGLSFNLKIDENLPDAFISDQQRFYQIIKNLISNAIKFTENGSISILLEPHKPHNSDVEQLKFSVKDTGIGIEENAQQLIFEAFSQADRSTSRKYGGTGLGLSISSDLAALLGGKITVESKLGEGSTFNFFLPLDTDPEFDDICKTEDLIIPSKTPPNVDLGDYAKTLKDKTILLVDDDTRNAFSLSELLDGFGIRSIVAESGIKALEELKKRVDIDLILMDMMMPGMDGNDAIERIRFMAKYEHVPIISLTANAMPQDQQKSMDAGANDYLTKPIDIETLLSKMHAWI